MNYNKKGISLIALMITILVITILASIMIPSGIDKINNARLASFSSNIMTLKEEIDSYMALNNLEYPVKTDASGSYAIYSINTSSTLLAEATKKDDQNDTFYIVDLQKLKADNVDEGMGATIDDYYIVAKTSRNVYYAKGIKIGDLVYHTKRNKGDGLIAVVPTSAATPTNTQTPTPTPGGPTPTPTPTSTPTPTPTPTLTPTPTPNPFAYNIPIVPTGFTHVGTEAWDTGYMIQDANGSQFVWIPVMAPSMHADGTLDGTSFTSKFGRRNFKANVFDSTGYDEPYDTALQDMKNSINTYGGFYIAKYEMSNNGCKAENKANKEPWMDITWDEAKIMSESMDTAWGWSPMIESYLCYGAHWDTVCEWLIDSGGKTSAQVITDSTTWGNYYNASFTYGAGITKAASSGSLINTGVTTVPANRHMAKGIYDFVGNMWEMTMESYSSTDRVIRGGSYRGQGGIQTAGYRTYSDPAYSDYNIGFRVVLNIKDPTTITITPTPAPTLSIEDCEDTTYAFPMTGNWVRETAQAYQGSYSFRNTILVDGATASTTFTVNQTLGAGETAKIKFWYLTASESGRDFFNVYVNGVKKLSASGVQTLWANYEAPLVNGANTVIFEYKKDATGYDGMDCVYIDNIEAYKTAAPTP